MKKKIIIGILIAALVVSGSAGGAVYYKKSHQKTVSVVSVDSLAGQYYMDDTNLDGNIVTSAVQSVSVDKDMIIKEVYVSKGDSVKKGDQLISFDMTLVQMELNIAKLKQEQQEQELNKAVNRLNSLKNGGKIEESDAEASDTSDSSGDTDTSSSLDEDGTDTASADGSINGTYLAAAVNPILAAAVIEPLESDIASEGAETAGDAAQQTQESADNTAQTASGDDTTSEDNENKDAVIDFDDTDTSDSEAVITPEPTTDPTTDASGEDFTDDIDVIDPDQESETGDLTDGNPTFYQTLDGDTQPYTGTGTKDDPYVFLCSSAKGYVVVKGSFLNKMAAFQADGTKEPGREGYWYQLEFHQNDTITNLLDRKESCTGYYLVDGGLLEKMVTDNSEVEFSLEGASHYDDDNQDDNDGDGGYDGGGDDGSASVSREEAIKIQQTKIDSLKLDIRESKLNIEKLEKKVKKEVIYSKLDGTVSKVGDPLTGASDGDSFMTIKSKEGYYVKGTVSELMLDEVKEGTILNCSSQNGDFEAEVIDVSEYPVSSDNYYGSGNPNVSYYTYTATIPDKTVKVSDEDWLTISLTNSSQSNGIVLDKAFVRSENGVSYVYKDDNGVLKKQVLSVGGNVNGGYSVLVTGGITRDDKIAFPYGDTVKEGAKTKEVSSSEIYGY